MLAIAAALFLATTGLAFRGLAVMSPVRWVTIEEILPEGAKSAWIEFLDPETADLAQRIPLTMLQDAASGAVLWAWEGYLRQRGPAQFKVMFRDVAGLTHEALPSTVETHVELDGIETDLQVDADAIEAPAEVLTV